MKKSRTQCRFECFSAESHRIHDGVAEHVEEGGLEEDVELGEGLVALGPQGVRRIQDLRDPLLLGEGWEGDRKSRDLCVGNRLLRGTGAKPILGKLEPI